MAYLSWKYVVMVVGYATLFTGLLLWVFGWVSRAWKYAVLAFGFTLMYLATTGTGWSVVPPVLQVGILVCFILSTSERREQSGCGDG